MPGGRPPLFETAEALEQKIEDYFESCKPNVNGLGEIKSFGETITISGLALYLGFESRQSFYDYEKHEEFSYIIKKARFRVECSYEKRLDSKNPTGAIFALKNMGWKDKHEVEQSGGIKLNFADPGDYIYPSTDQSNTGIPESI